MKDQDGQKISIKAEIDKELLIEINNIIDELEKRLRNLKINIKI